MSAPLPDALRARFQRLVEEGFKAFRLYIETSRIAFRVRPEGEATNKRFKVKLKRYSGRAAALRLNLSPATGARWGSAIRRTGQARAAPQGRPRGKGKLDPHRAFLVERVDQDGDMTMPELAGALEKATGAQAHPDAVGRFLRKLGFTYKKRHWSRRSDATQG